MPRSMMAGESAMATVGKRDSKRPDWLCTKRGCVASVTPTPSSAPPGPKGTQPSSAASWQPLQMPSENVSGRA